MTPELLRECTVHPHRRDHDPERPVDAGTRDRHADRLIELVTLIAGLEPQPLGRLSLERPADERAAREVLVRTASRSSGPGLEDPGRIGDEHPIGAGLGAQLVGLVEQVGAIVGAERLTDPLT